MNLENGAVDTQMMGVIRRAISSVLSVGLLCVIQIGGARADRPPPAMMDNVESLSILGAVLQICFVDPQFKKVPTPVALNLHRLDLRIRDLVEKITNHYREDALVTAYHLAVLKYSKSTDLRKQVVERYGEACGSKMFADVGLRVKEAERSIGAFLKPKQK